MNRWVLACAAGCCVLGVSVCMADPFVSYDWPLRVPSLTISAPAAFSFADGFDRVEMIAPSFLTDADAFRHDVNLAPITVKGRHVASTSATRPDADPSTDHVSELQRPMFDYVHGEVGFLYGRSTGRFARDFESGYLNGTVGNEHMQISAGAAYENLSGGRGRFGR